MIRLNAKQLRKSSPGHEETSVLSKNPIYLVLDNVIDTYNIGSLFRLADAVGVTKIFLCGDMEYPPSSRIHKAAVGTENWTPWEKKASALEVVQALQKQNVEVIAVEQHTNSTNYKNISPNFPVAIVVGNETSGVSPEVLKVANKIVELPMMGINKSFNVWGSAAVVCYKILESLI